MKKIILFAAVVLAFVFTTPTISSARNYHHYKRFHHPHSFNKHYYPRYYNPGCNSGFYNRGFYNQGYSNLKPYYSGTYYGYRPYPLYSPYKSGSGVIFR